MRNTGVVLAASPSRDLALCVRSTGWLGSRLIIPLCACASWAGCASDDSAASPVGIALVAEKGGDTWSRTPAPVKLSILASVTGDDTPRSVLSSAWPVDSFSLGSLERTDTVALDGTLADETGADVIRCASAQFATSEFEGHEVSMFCGRIGEFSVAIPSIAMPVYAGNITPEQAWSVALDDRFAILGALDSTSTVILDRATLTSYAGSVALPVAPRTIAALDGRSLLLISATTAKAFDTQTGDVFDVDLHGLSAADLAGGQVVSASDGTLYVVGGTRSALLGPATDAILVIAPDGAITSAHLSEARTAAVAIWVDDTGLIVVGGDAEAHAELLVSGASRATPLAGNALAALSGAAAFTSGGSVLLVGGTTSGEIAPCWKLDARCTSACSLTEVGPAVSFRMPTAAPQPDGSVLMIGRATAVDPEGHSVVTDAGAIVRFNGSAVTSESVLLHVQRHHSAMLPLRDGWVLVSGGNESNPSSSAELFAPR